LIMLSIFLACNEQMIKIHPFLSKINTNIIAKVKVCNVKQLFDINISVYKKLHTVLCTAKTSF